MRNVNRQDLGQDPLVPSQGADLDELPAQRFTKNPLPGGTKAMGMPT